MSHAFGKRPEAVRTPFIPDPVIGDDGPRNCKRVSAFFADLSIAQRNRRLSSQALVDVPS